MMLDRLKYVVISVVLLGVSAAAEAQRSEVDAQGRPCRICHADKFAALVNNPHSALDTDENLSCLDCHGDVASHIQSGGGQGNVFAFALEAAQSQNDRCLACHVSTHPDYERSPHASLACTSCHSQHADGIAARALLDAPTPPADFARLGAESAVCFDCHGEIFTQFNFNERHRLQEGILDCVSCHDPHAAQSRSLLGGFKQEQCTDCHTDKRGPFVFEHDASRVEGCTACHTPHGAPNRHLLTQQRVGELCYSCHAEVPQFHLGFAPGAPPRFNLDTQCTNCHSAIHGSNFDPTFLR